MHPVSPTRLIGGRYVVLAELGRGGMGVVWRAEDRVMGRHVAVKELHLPDGLGPEDRDRFRQRLLREARTAGRLNHPSIVTVHDVVNDGGVDHIVMELVEAPTLTDVVTRSGPLDERTATDVARQLLSALRAAHDRGVVHRDVKPSNVMLAADGRVTLTDFGIAQAVDDPRLTMSGAVLGSPGYLAPERLESAVAPPASDLWSLGATLYYATSGIGPFSRETTAATVAAVLNADVPVVRTRGALGAVIAGLLQRRPEVRLTAVQAAALLAGGPTGESSPPSPVGGPASTGTGSPPSRRPRRPLLIGALVGVLALGVAIGLGATQLWPRGATPAVLTYGAGGDLPVWEFSSASCVDGELVVGHQFPSSAAVSCDSPHELEVFATVDLLDTEHDLTWPGRDALAGAAGPSCQLVFDSALVAGPDKSALRVAVLVPSAGAFSNRPGPTSSFSDRHAVCVLRRADGSQLSGTRIAP